MAIMPMRYHSSIHTPVGMSAIIDPYNPLALLLLFLSMDILPSMIASILLTIADIDPFMETMKDEDIRSMTLYPLYPVFFPFWKHGYSMLSVATWMVFFFPVFEEVLFFAVPAMYGSLPMAIVCGVFWALVHIARFMSWAWMMGYSAKQLFIALVAQVIAFIPPAVMSAILWVSGLGIVSILLHSFHNALAIISLVRGSRRGRVKEVPRRYYRVRERKYYKIRSYS